ncbi:unnamed protein product [Musa acuminata subsp. burmannicoides]
MHTPLLKNHNSQTHYSPQCINLPVIYKSTLLQSRGKCTHSAGEQSNEGHDGSQSNRAGAGRTPHSSIVHGRRRAGGRAMLLRADLGEDQHEQQQQQRDLRSEAGRCHSERGR